MVKIQSARRRKSENQIFEEGAPKNFIPAESLQRIADRRIGSKDNGKPSRIVDHAELKKNDYNTSPSAYIHFGDAETPPMNAYRQCRAA